MELKKTLESDKKEKLDSILNTYKEAYTKIKIAGSYALIQQLLTARKSFTGLILLYSTKNYDLGDYVDKVKKIQNGEEI